MTRTPLFGVVVRSLRQADRANRTGLSVAGIVERDRSARTALRQARRALRAHEAEAGGMTRRRFLGTSSAAVAGLALTGCSLATRPAARPGVDPVLIVGAGIAGLMAGYRLRQSGVPVRIMEAQNRVGGRMLSLRGFFADGQVAELGGELIDTDHTAMHALAVELGFPLDDLSIEDAGITTDTWFFGGRPRGEVEIVEAFRPVAASIVADLATIGGDVSYRSPSGAATLDRLSLAEWLERAGIDGWLRALLDVGYTTEYGLEIDEQSALNLLFLIDPRAEPFRIYGDSDERFHVRGGNDHLPRELGRRLDDAIETNVHLEAVRAAADGRFVCSFTRGAAAFDVVAADVVFALPFTLLRRVRIDVVLPPAKRRAIDEIGYGTNAKLMIGFTDRVWRDRHRTNGSVLTDLPFQLVWETSRHQPGESGILTNFTGGRHGVAIGTGSATDQAAAAVGALEQVFPGIEATRAGAREARFHWPTHPYTLGSYACYRPGQWTTIAGAEGEPVGRLFFAGEHCSTRAQGFMEGGCETGEAAARAVLAVRGVRSGAAPIARRVLLRARA